MSISVKQLATLFAILTLGSSITIQSRSSVSSRLWSNTGKTEYDFGSAALRRGVQNERTTAPSFSKPVFRYRILQAATVLEDCSHSLPFLVETFEIENSSKARKSIRFGEFVLLPGSNYPTVPHSKLSELTEKDFVRDEAQFLKNLTLVKLESVSPIYEGDTIIRITRIHGKEYSVLQTGNVQPPALKQWPEIVFQDDSIAVVNKPEGLTTIGVPGQDLKSALPFLLSPPALQCDGYLPRPVHRLDGRTSGLVIVAKSKFALRNLSIDFADRQVFKTYTTLVFGDPVDQSGTIDYPISGKKAVSDWRVLQRGERFTLLEVKPKTGRNHQIRRHLSYCLQLPIVGDNKYDRGYLKEYRAKGLFLCSNAVTFTHPVTNDELSFSILIPSKFTELLATTSNSIADATVPQSIDDQVELVREILGDRFETNEGVECVGEPPVDPSRLIDPNQGDSEWIEDW